MDTPEASTTKHMDAKDVEAGTPPAHGFGLSVERLNAINEMKDLEAIKGIGGMDGLAKCLLVDMHHGLDPHSTGDTSLTTRRSCFGENRLPEAPAKLFIALMWDAAQDPIIIILVLAALVSTVLGAAIEEQRKHQEYIEGVAIWVAVTIVILVGAGNDYKKDQQFRKLNATKDKVRVRVWRNGEPMLVENTELVVGDVYLLDTGDKVAADGVLIETQGLVIDEASLTGESDPIKKTDEDPWVRSGTQVSEGSGKILVTAVGLSSEWGKTMMLVGEAGDDETPLQIKLGVVAGIVGKVGLFVAAACFIALLIKWFIVNDSSTYASKVNDHGPIQFFLFAITIIVVAIPEGLPLAVTISLAYSMQKMMKDNNFVRVLAACETMGGATAICSDKTGTLTENRMTVVEGWFAGVVYASTPGPSELPGDVAEHLRLNSALNSKALVLENNGKIDFAGNRTECALLLMLRSWGEDYAALRSKHEQQLFKMYGFSSAKKMASCVLQLPDKYRLYNKGAAEWVLKRCTSMYAPDGSIVPMSDEKREELGAIVTEMAKRGLRCICLTTKDLPLNDPARGADFFETADQLDNDLTALAVVGIKDPVRKEVPEAVRVCQRAGITVRMVTGDNIFTAQHIARECGILHDEQGMIAMEGPTFRVTPAVEMVALLPKLRVLARSSPEDKLTLVRMLKDQGEVVAVTGDGTNDAPALKESDVGLAMGIAGTEVAKEAADIVILDDNFSSIVKSVMWGRSVFANIRKFLMFQLTVNFVALVISFFGAVIGGQEPLNVLQLLWVNLIMDTLGALALATEDPSPSLLLQKPNGRTEALISRTMWKHIGIQGCYQLFWMFLFLYGFPTFFKRYQIRSADYFYTTQCNNYVAAPPAGQPDTCAVASYCGLSGLYGSADTKYTSKCPLAPQWQYPDMPTDLKKAICANSAIAGNATAMKELSDCPALASVNAAATVLDKEYKRFEKLEYRPLLSLLFNVFIFCQVFNEINARRINDEYTIFEGLFSNHIFMGVIGITVCFQVLIINVPGLNTSFFKVQPLAWDEWLYSIAIGFGSIPLSFATRFISRNFSGDVSCLRGSRVHAQPNMRTLSGNVVSVTRAGRTMSGNSRTVSGGK